MGERMVKCAKLGETLPGLEEPPYTGELGQRIYENVSKKAWEMWKEHLKMILNEYQLNPATLEAWEIISKEAEKFFFGAEAKLPPGYVPPKH
ncbi:MAG: oxidative damage protection protein [Acidobacteria bacterium RIFCSPHIGHO2_12_FULL_67_30]|nr:MAG: oxidative damage protection protein [Acidobacteria bacterium RIFCSPHIGHO2_01_FULL_67_28]OFV89313.1 MAG: oxidative damage protection protein [Acidobacteria bacterium RIFCSPHIGHO2_12_FULL_67_30]